MATLSVEKYDRKKGGGGGGGGEEDSALNIHYVAGTNEFYGRN